MSLIIGFILVFFGAFSTGTSGWPLKMVKDNKIERYLFVGKIFGIIILPWIIMFCICDVSKVIYIVGAKQIILANLFSLAWGVANFFATACLVRIGFVLTSVLVGASSVIVATLIPLIFKGSGVFANSPSIMSKEGFISIISVIILIISIILISLSNDLRDRQLGKKGFDCIDMPPWKHNLYKIFAIFAGAFSTGIFMVTTYCGHSILGAMKTVGVTGPIKNIAIWAIGMFAGGLVNIITGILLMAKNKSFHTLLNWKETGYFMCNGIQFIIYLLLLSMGTFMIGPLGASIGGGVARSVIIGGQQFLGFAFGEWKGVKGKPIAVFVLGMILLLIGILLLTFK